MSRIWGMPYRLHEKDNLQYFLIGEMGGGPLQGNTIFSNPIYEILCPVAVIPIGPSFKLHYVLFVRRVCLKIPKV